MWGSLPLWCCMSVCGSCRVPEVCRRKRGELPFEAEYVDLCRFGQCVVGVCGLVASYASVGLVSDEVVDLW